MKTQILTIQELYDLIPETKSLEGKNFENIRALLTELIAAIEKSGKWEFVMHASNAKPSLFVIRTTPVVASGKFDSKKFQEISNMLKDMKKIYANIKGMNFPNPVKSPDPVPVETIVCLPDFIALIANS